MDWSELKIESIRKRATKKALEVKTGIKTLGALNWLEFTEEKGLMQLVKDNTMKESTGSYLDKFGLSQKHRDPSQFFRTDHSTMKMEYLISKKEEERQDITSPYSTKIPD